MRSAEEALAIIEDNYNLEGVRSIPLPPKVSLPKPPRKVSYGTFLPHFVLNTESLTRLLAESDTQKNVRTHGQALKTSETGNDVVGKNPPHILHLPCQSKYISNKAQQLTRQRSCHCEEFDVKSLGRKEISDPSEARSAFLIECNRQLDNLWSFMESQLNVVNDELERYGTKRLCAEEKSPKRCSSDYIEADVSETHGLLESVEVDSASAGEDSGIEDDQLLSARGLLGRLREVVNSLKQNMETNLQKIDKLMCMNYQQIHSKNGPVPLPTRAQEAVYKSKLDVCVSRIDQELDEMDRVAKKSQQKMKENKLVLLQAEKFQLRFWVLLALAVLLATFLTLCVFSRNRVKHWVIFVRLVRSPLLIALYFYMYGFNLIAWAKNEIDYISIFKFPTKGVPTPKLAFQIGSILSIAFCSLVVIYFFLSQSYRYVTDKAVAFSMWLV